MQQIQNNHIHNLIELDANIKTSGQPFHSLDLRRDETDGSIRDGIIQNFIDAIHELKVTHVINIGTDGKEATADQRLKTSDGRFEKDLLDKDIDYFQLPVDFTKPTEEKFNQYVKKMKEIEETGGKCLVHCVANMRVSAFEALRRFKERTYTENQADQLINMAWDAQQKPIDGQTVWDKFVKDMKAKIIEQRGFTEEQKEALKELGKEVLSDEEKKDLVQADPVFATGQINNHSILGFIKLTSAKPEIKSSIDDLRSSSESPPPPDHQIGLVVCQTEERHRTGTRSTPGREWTGQDVKVLNWRRVSDSGRKAVAEKLQNGGRVNLTVQKFDCEAQQKKVQSI